MYTESIEEMGQDGGKEISKIPSFPQIFWIICLALYIYPSHTIYFFVVWHYLDQGLGEAKASFGIIKLKDGYFDDPNCVAV